jgi:putative NADH-flavin reductase
MEETVMPTKEEVAVLEEDLSETQEVPEVEVTGDEAVIRVVKETEGVEERRVRLPKTIWG